MQRLRGLGAYLTLNDAPLVAYSVRSMLAIVQNIILNHVWAMYGPCTTVGKIATMRLVYAY